METNEQWENRVQLWVYPDGAVYSQSVTAPAPSKNFLQVFLSANQVILRIWKILPPTRADSNQAPAQYMCTYAEFAEEESMRGEIERNFGLAELCYLDLLTARKLDYLARLPKKVLMIIFSYLDLVSLSKMSQVNKLFRELCNSDELWFKIYMDHAKKQPTQELLLLVDQKGWKEVFFMNKLQLQVQMRRTTKESSNFFLTSNRQHSSDDEENSSEHPTHFHLEREHGSRGQRKMHGRQHGESQLSEYEDSSQPQYKNYRDEDQTLQEHEVLHEDDNDTSD